MPKPKQMLPPEEAAPVFDGFTPEAAKFLHGLKKNNNKEWFEKHRDEYELNLREPCKGLVHAISQQFKEQNLPLIANPKTSLFRINRDIRFSSNKSPYKTHIGIVFPFANSAKDQWCGCYIGMEPAAKGKGLKVNAGGGAHMPMSAYLKRIRAKIASEDKTFAKILKSETLAEFFPEGLHGESLKRMPVGYAEDHPLASILKLKDFTLSTDLDEAVLYEESLPERLADLYAAAIPMIQFLGSA